jgi:hypothetical protein
MRALLFVSRCRRASKFSALQAHALTSRSVTMLHQADQVDLFDAIKQCR